MDDLITVGFLDMRIRNLRLELEEAVRQRSAFPDSVLQVKSLPRKSKATAKAGYAAAV
jgi:hypothetical protein